MYLRIMAPMRAAITAAVTLCLLSTASAAAPDEAMVSIGLAAPLSGISEKFGKSFLQAAQVAIDQSNQSGLMIGGRRIQLSLVPVDDRGDARSSGLAAQYLIKKGVVGVVGHGMTAASLAAAPFYEQANMAMISGSSSSRELTQRGYHNVFRTIGHDDAAAVHAANYLRQSLGLRRMAVIDDGSAFGTRLAKQFAQAFTDGGAILATRQSINDKTSDFNELLSLLKTRQVDGVFFGGNVRQAAELMQNMRRVGLAARFMTGSNGAVDLQFLDIAGAASEGALSIEPGVPPEKMTGWKQFSDAYARRGDAPMSTFAPFVHDATLALVAAIRLAASTEPDKVALALHKVSLQGLGGRIAFDAQGNLIDPAYTIYEVRQQRWTVQRQLGAGH